jgi:hypothetical protein
MKSETAREFLSIVEKQVALRPALIEYEMAYQVSVAMDRIQFAIRHIEKIGLNANENHEATLQVLDALDRLTRAERKFQGHFRAPARDRQSPSAGPDGGGE